VAAAKRKNKGKQACMEKCRSKYRILRQMASKRKRGSSDMMRKNDGSTLAHLPRYQNSGGKTGEILRELYVYLG